MHWVAIRDFVIASASALEESTEDARRSMTHAAKYVDWAHFVGGYDLDQTLWDADLISEYMDTETRQLSPLVRKATKARLIRIARANNPGAMPEVDELGFRASWQPNP